MVKISGFSGYGVGVDNKEEGIKWHEILYVFFHRTDHLLTWHRYIFYVISF